MPLMQVRDTFNEPLDLWLSPNHEGQRRYVRLDDLVAGSTGARPSNGDVSDPRLAGLLALPGTGPATTAPKSGSGKSGSGNAVVTFAGVPEDGADDDAVLCSFIPGTAGGGDGGGGGGGKVSSAAVPWLQQRGAGNGDTSCGNCNNCNACSIVSKSAAAPFKAGEDEEMVMKVPAPPPVGRMASLKPIPTVLPHPDKKDPVMLAEEARMFSSEAGCCKLKRLLKMPGGSA